ncbi:MAG: TPM domain-containing protein [Patescibacteria group bacterium]
MKKLILITIIPCLLFAGIVSAYYNPGTPDGFVNDYAGMLNESEKQTLEDKLVQFEKDSSNEISVVTIPSLEEDVIENFAVKLFEDWGIGKTKNDNGVLVLIARDDRQMRIEVGYGLEGALTDAQSWYIIDKIMKPAFQNEDYYSGIDQAVDKIIAATKGEYIPESQPEGKSNNWEMIFWVGIFIFMWIASVLGRSKSWWAGGVLGGVAGVIIGLIKGFILVGLVSLAVLIPFGLLFDFIVSKNYAKHKSRGSIPWWIGGGKGGRGGFGGGFGGFGGGSSGGGGASGSW